MKENNPDRQPLKIIATKVPEDSYDLLRRLCEKQGINPYTLVQWMANVFIRFGDDLHNLDGRLCKAIRLFEEPKSWGDTYNIFRNSPSECRGAVYLLGNPGCGKPGAAFVGPDFCGDRECTYNARDILEMVFETTFPSAYAKVRRAGVEMGTSSVIETVCELIDEHTGGRDLDEIRRMFEDNRRHEDHRKTGADATAENDTPYKSHRRNATAP